MDDWRSIPCPIQRTATLLTDRYVIMILRDLSSGTKRFRDLEASGINPRTLTARLRHMLSVGLIIRSPSSEGGYALAEKGQALIPLLEFLRTYGETWLPIPPACAANGAKESCGHD